MTEFNHLALFIRQSPGNVPAWDLVDASRGNSVDGFVTGTSWPDVYDRIARLVRTEATPVYAYGGPVSGMHPERDKAVLEAMSRHEKNEDTEADRVLLWFDVALQAARATPSQ